MRVINKFSLLVFVFVTVGLLYFLFSKEIAEDSGSVTPNLLVDDLSKDEYVPPAKRTSPPVNKQRAEQVSTVKTVELTEEQLQKVSEQKDELTTMMRDYDDVRDDPQLRNLHREEMEGKLEEYSKNVLPIALKKINENNQTPTN